MGSGTDDGWQAGERRRAAVFSAVVLGAVLSPLAQYLRPVDRRHDGFPLSWYPMFSARRPRRCRVTYAVGVRSDGVRRYLPEGAFGPGGLNQVRRQLHRVSVREARPEAYAAALAARVARRTDCPDVLRVEVIRGRFDLDDCFLGRVVEGRLEVLASAAVTDRTPVASTVPSRAVTA
jgi:hypothetical protein